MEKILSTQASQSVSKIISIKVANKSNRIILTASTSELQFDGYKKIYQDEETNNVNKNKDIEISDALLSRINEI